MREWFCERRGPSEISGVSWYFRLFSCSFWCPSLIQASLDGCLKSVLYRQKGPCRLPAIQCLSRLVMAAAPRRIHRQPGTIRLVLIRNALFPSQLHPPLSSNIFRNRRPVNILSCSLSLRIDFAPKHGQTVASWTPHPSACRKPSQLLVKIER